MTPAPVMLPPPPVAALVSACAIDPLKVTVTSVSGRSVYLNKGRADGVAPGAVVRLRPAGAAVIEAVVADVSSNSSRIELPAELRLPTVGTEGEVELSEPPPTPATPPADEPKPQPATPEHPPWTRQEGQRTEDMPLLAPAFSKPADERPSTFHGRVFSQAQLTLDRGGDRDNTYLLARLGTSFEATNPFGQGGRLRFDGEFDYRSATAPGTWDLSQADPIINQFSYSIGGEQYSSYRAEFGRFTPQALPEIPLVDGAEFTLQLESGLNLGVGAGAYPRDYPDRDWGSEYGFHVFLDYRPGVNGEFSGTLGYQKTWNEGTSDRDLFIGRVTLVPVKSLWMYGSILVDLYGSEDTLKTSKVEITQALAQIRFTPGRNGGVGFTYSHFTYPETKEVLYEFVPPSLIQTGKVDRFILSAWGDIVENVRLTARGSVFQDQNGDGSSAEADCDWSRIFGTSLAVRAGVFYTDATYTTGTGFRADVRAGDGDLQGIFSYEFFPYTQVGLIGGNESFVRQTVRLGLNIQSGKWFYNLSADYYFGDGENAYGMGAFVEYHF